MSSGRVKTPVSQLEAIYRYVKGHPGTRLHIIAGALGMSYWQVSNRLVSMERVGLCLSEDEEGRLYPFSWRGYHDYQSL